MNTSAAVGTLCAILGAVFLVLAAADFAQRGMTATPARKAWLLTGGIFSAVGAYLLMRY